MKRVLTIDDDSDFSLLGIGCHAKDYRLIWEINKLLKIDLAKNAISPDENPSMHASSFSCVDEESHIQYHLIANKNENGLIVREYPQLDYFIRIDGSLHSEELVRIKGLIQRIDLVLTVIEIDPDSLRSKVNLIFE